MQDEEKTVIQTLYVFMIVALLGSILVLVSSVVLSRGVLNSFGISGLVGAITCLVVLWLLRIKQSAIPRIFLPSVVYLLATTLIFTGVTVGVRDDAVLLYSLVVAMAGLLLGKRGVIIFGVLSVITVGYSVYAEVNGLIVNHIDIHTTSYITLVTVAVTYSLTFGMMYMLVSILTSNLEKMRLNQKQLSQANHELQSIRASLEVQVQERTSVAETARSEAESARKTAETQVWLTSGQAQLAEQMRGDLDVSVLANNIVRHLCRYIGAQTGVLFLAEGDSLHLMGSYAYTERPGAKNVIKFGEGLVGQAARENNQVILTQIPADTLLIASSLGESLPRQLLIAPLEVEGAVIGVLELATLNELTTAHQVFISRAAESIAIAFRTAKTRERIVSLLADSQRQTEELQAQEEELRAANEELQLQAENMSAASKPGRK